MEAQDMLFTEMDALSHTSPSNENLPLAARLRPRSISEFFGQEHILGKGKLLRNLIQSDCFSSIIFWGPPGIGKTSLAGIIARTTSAHIENLSAVSTTVKDVRERINNAKCRIANNKTSRTIIFLDEIHRFNKAQQDVLLPDIENGIIRLIGATTENPYFHILGPLLSRSQLFQLNPLSTNEIRNIIQNATTDERGFSNRTVTITTDACDYLASACEGDARKALNHLEIAVEAVLAGNNDTSEVIKLDLNIVSDAMPVKSVRYGDDEHYDTISAFIKSMRGGDPDATIYWLAKMLNAGDDTNYISRRIVTFAAEDVGNADPRALTVAVNAMQGVNMVGMPEARIILAQAAIYCATAPKSNAALQAIDNALHDVKTKNVQPVPAFLKDQHYQGGKKLGHGEDYQYPHNFPSQITSQEYQSVPKKYYNPVNSGYEARISDRLKIWDEGRINKVAT